jgi:hypothetical protein
MRDRDRLYQNEIAIHVFSVTAKDFSHGVLLDRVDRRSSYLALRQGYSELVSLSSREPTFPCSANYQLRRREETQVVGSSSYLSSQRQAPDAAITRVACWIAENVSDVFNRWCEMRYKVGALAGRLVGALAVAFAVQPFDLPR